MNKDVREFWLHTARSRLRRTQAGSGKGPAMATETLGLRSTAQRSGPSSRATGLPRSLVMPGRTMTPFRSPLTHTVRVAASQSSSRPYTAQTV